MSIEAELTTDNSIAIMGVGDRLKAERIARGLSLEDVSQTLKVSPRVLAQLEANAWAELPGHTFARGIVRGYAKFVHLDADSLLHELENAPLPKLPTLKVPQSTMTALPVAGQSLFRDRLAVIAGVLMVSGAVMAYFLVPEDWLASKTVVVSKPVAQQAVVAAPDAVPLVAPISGATGAAIDSPNVVPPSSTPLPEATPAPAGITSAPASAMTAAALVLRFEQTSWVEVKDRNGVMLLSENVAPGSERTVSVTGPFSLALGNAEGVRVSLRGKNVDLVPHTRQKVARLSLE